MTTEAIKHLPRERKPPIVLNADEAAGMAIRVEDAAALMNKLLDYAEQSLEPDNHRSRALVTIARDRHRHLEYVIQLLRGEVKSTASNP